MLKRFLMLLVAAGLIFSIVNFSSAQVLSEKELSAAKKQELNGTQWNVTVKPLSGGGSAESDVIIFSDGQMSSKNLQSAGFEATDFTVRVEEDGTVIWETMQVDGKDNFAFWRGDINEGVMRGVLTQKDNSGRTFDFSFTNKQ